MQAVLLLMTGVGAGVFGTSLVLRPHQPALQSAVPVGGRAPAVQASAAPAGFAPVPVPVVAGRPAPLAAHIPPVEVAIPAIKVRSDLVGLRLNLDGTLQVPQDYATAGWYSDGPAPGDRGAPAVIVGHVDSHTGPGVFYRLPELKDGDPVFVRRADGVSLRFDVYRVADYAKNAFPNRAVYAPTARPELRLLTCTGVFDSATGHYLSNDVVYAALTPVAAAHPAPAHPAAAHPAPAHPAPAHAPTRAVPVHAAPAQAPTRAVPVHAGTRDGPARVVPRPAAPSPALLTPSTPTSVPLGPR